MYFSLKFRWSRKKCYGLDKKYETCFSKQVFYEIIKNINEVLLFFFWISRKSQCYNVPRTTVLEFANQICERAKKFDSNIHSEGLQEISDNPENSCRVFCKSKNGKPITKSWTFPDGTICRNHNSDIDDKYFCVNGRCEVCKKWKVNWSIFNIVVNYFVLEIHLWQFVKQLF